MDYLLETVIWYSNVIKHLLSCVLLSCSVPVHFVIVLVWQLSKALETALAKMKIFKLKDFLLEIQRQMV